MPSAVDVLSDFEDNTKWLSVNYDKLKKEFINEWVAILDKAIVDHDSDLTLLVARLRAHHSKVYNQIAVEFVTNEELDLIL